MTQTESALVLSLAVPYVVVGLCDSYRGSPVGWSKHGSSSLCSGWKREKIHKCEGINKLSILQRGKELKKCPYYNNVMK